jgi:hypothetical protein
MSVKNLGENTQVAPELRIPCPARLGEIGLTCALSINRRLRTLSHLDHRSGDNPKVSREKSIFFSRLRGGKPGGASSVAGVDDTGHHSSRKRRPTRFRKVAGDARRERGCFDARTCLCNRVSRDWSLLKGEKESLCGRPGDQQKAASRRFRPPRD